MNQYTKRLLQLLPGLLLFAAWPVNGFTPIVFIAFASLLYLEYNCRNAFRFFWILWLNLLIWNALTTWWIWNASPGGAAGAILVNSLLMCIPWMLYRFTRRFLGMAAGLGALVFYWITWEYIHHNWELSWPWLTLGNIFATHTNWVQWYEYTGTTGGTLWVLLVNIFLWSAIYPSQKSRTPYSFRIKPLLPALVAFVVPLAASYLLLSKRQPLQTQIKNGVNVVVVQPNVEPYTEKFATEPSVLIQRMIRLSESKIDDSTRLVIWPETAIPVQVWENEISYNEYYKPVFQFVKSHPQLQLLTGIDSYKNWGGADKKGFSIRTLTNGDKYEAYNTALATDNSGEFQLYHKSKLVPGVESLPSWLGFMSDIFDDLGGTTGTLGISDSAHVFSFYGNPYRPAPIICYESIYSNYVSQYTRKGANILTIITNDGWWGETPGYKQHMNMGRLRAIENRRWVARSANTGISCFISPLGEVLQPQPWNTASAIKMPVEPINELTFYSLHGDWLSRVIWPLAIFAFTIAIFKKPKKQKTIPR